MQFFVSLLCEFPLKGAAQKLSRYSIGQLVKVTIATETQHGALCHTTDDGVKGFATHEHMSGTVMLLIREINFRHTCSHG